MSARGLGAVLLGIALCGCETVAQDEAAIAPAEPAQTAHACQTAPIVLADGRRVQPTCGTYQQCGLFKPVTAAGARTSGVPFFVTRSGQITRDYPGTANCLPITTL